jgi:hypothetical protein
MLAELELYVTNVIAINETVFKQNNPHIFDLTLVKLRNDMKSGIDKAIEESLKKEGEVEKMSEVVNHAANEVVRTYAENRRILAINYVLEVVMEMVAQHFLLLSDDPDAAFTKELSACETCSENMFYEPFPPNNFINCMVEGVLFEMDNPFCDTPEKRMLTAKQAAHFIMHEWLSADPKTRL